MTAIVSDIASKYIYYFNDFELFYSIARGAIENRNSNLLLRDILLLAIALLENF